MIPYITVQVREDNRVLRHGLTKSCLVRVLTENSWSFGFIDKRSHRYDTAYTRPLLFVEEFQNPYRYEITIKQCVTDFTLDLSVNKILVLEDLGKHVGEKIVVPTARFPCPKCGSLKTQMCVGCGDTGRYRCDNCGFVATERIFKSGILPSKK